MKLSMQLDECDVAGRLMKEFEGHTGGTLTVEVIPPGFTARISVFSSGGNKAEIRVPAGALFIAAKAVGAFAPGGG